jgi:tyramine---L-glutamate ligase
MKIAVLEHFTSLSSDRATDERIVEGRAMRQAIVADLARLPGTEVVVVERREDFARALVVARAALVVAPEEDGILETLCRTVERHGRILLGPSSSVVRLAADKLRTARVLAAAGVPTPRTRAIAFDAALPRLRAPRLPLVMKPRDGCGGQGVVVVRHETEIPEALGIVRRATRRRDFLVQDYVAGAAASVAFVVSGTCLDLGLTRQSLQRGPFLGYVGGETLWPHPLAGAAIETARAAIEALARACGGARGYLGVDLVLGRGGVSVIEVNPRLTTSYVGLRQSFGGNLAGLLVEAATDLPFSARPRALGRCRFRADGTVRMLSTAPLVLTRDRPRCAAGPQRQGWETAPAGTSAASI